VRKKPKPKHRTKKPPQYEEGPKALRNFEETMKTLFRAPKTPKKGKD